MGSSTFSVRAAEQESFEIEARYRSLNPWAQTVPSARASELRRAIAAHREQEQRARRRVEVEAVLRPGRRVFHRTFLAELCNHAIALAIENDIVVKPARLDYSRANVGSRTIWTAAVLSEAAYADFLHEAGHLLEPSADGEQQPYKQLERTIAAPLAEVAAWRWALRTCWRHTWTVSMHERLTLGLRSYEAVAGPSEVEIIQRVINIESLGAIVPAPDSVEGLLAKLDTQDRALKFRASEAERRKRWSAPAPAGSFGALREKLDTPLPWARRG